MEENRPSDLRVPLIAAIFCISVFTGGVFLVLYCFVPSLSEPWYPVVALLLIGSPWLFWFVTYGYSCLKHCCCRDRGQDGGIIMRHTPSRAGSAAADHNLRQQTMQRNVSAGNLSVTSSKEFEMPLNTSRPSS